MSNEKKNGQDLINGISKKSGETKKELELFLREFIALLQESLLRDKLVKIKGLGTFKLVWNESRKSVNVQTGEEIEIPGHYKVAFAPENELKDFVNAPYAHLETVILNEDGEEEQPKDEKPNPMKNFSTQALEIVSLISELNIVSVESKDNATDSTSEEQQASSEIIREEESVEEILATVPPVEDKTLENDENIAPIPELLSATTENEIAVVSEETAIPDDEVSDNRGEEEKNAAEVELYETEQEAEVQLEADIRYHVEEKEEVSVQPVIDDDTNLTISNNKMEDNNFETSPATPKAPGLYQHPDGTYYYYSGEEPEEVEDVVEDESVEEYADTDADNDEFVEENNTEMLENDDDDEYEEDYDDEELKDEEETKKSFWKAFFIILFLLLIGAVAACYFFAPDIFNKYYNMALSKVSPKTEQVAPPTEENKAATELVGQDTETGTPEVDEQQTQMPAASDEQVVTPAAQADTRPSYTFNVSDYEMNYVTVTEGMRLAEYSRRYYGGNHVFWPYIYLANKDKISNPDRLVAGQRIKIPKLPAEMVNPKNPKAMDHINYIREHLLDY